MTGCGRFKTLMNSLSLSFFFSCFCVDPTGGWTIILVTLSCTTINSLKIQGFRLLFCECNWKSMRERGSCRRAQSRDLCLVSLCYTLFKDADWNVKRKLNLLLTVVALSISFLILIKSGNDGAIISLKVIAFRSSKGSKVWPSTFFFNAIRRTNPLNVKLLPLQVLILSNPNLNCFISFVWKIHGTWANFFHLMRRWIMKDNDSKICKLKSTLGNYYAQNWKLKAKKKKSRWHRKESDLIS